VAVTVVPQPGVDAIASRPPMPSMRSRITSRPKWPCAVPTAAVVSHRERRRAGCRVDHEPDVHRGAVRMVDRVANRLLGHEEQITGDEFGQFEGRVGRVHGDPRCVARPAPLKRRHFRRENLWVVQTKGGQKMPRGKKFTAEQIIGKLREAEVGLAQGKTVPEVVRKLGVTEQTYYRWKREYGGLRTDQAKRLKDLEKENARLKRLLADAELDKAILREAASGCRRRAQLNF
jgi:putative transposase